MKKIMYTTDLNLKKEKGSITIFVLVGLLFMSAFLLISYAYNVNKSKTAKEQFNIMSDIYSHKDGDANAYERAYTALRKKNKQTLTYDSQKEGLTSISSVELDKTFEDSVRNYRIYGTAEGVGDRVNLLNNKDLLVTTNSNAQWEITETGIKQTRLSGQGYIKTMLYDITDIVEPNTTYYVHTDILRNFECTNSTANQISGSLRVYIDGNHGVDIYYGSNKTRSGSFTMPESFSEVKIGTYTVVEDTVIANFDDTETYYFEWKNLYLSKIPYTEYVPYGKYKIQVSATRRNLANEVVNGYVNINSFPQLEDTSSSVFKTIVLKNLKAGTYTFSFEKPVYIVRSVSTSSHNTTTAIAVSPRVNNVTVVKVTLTQDEEEYYLSFRDNTSSTTEWGDAWIQCEKGENATSYEQPNKIMNIILDNPLKDGEYIDFKLGKVVRAGGTEEHVNLQELQTFEDYTKIEVLTEVAPSRIEIEYVGYTFE